MIDEIRYGAWLRVYTDGGSFLVDSTILGAERTAYHISYEGVRVIDAVGDLYKHMPCDVGAALIHDCELEEGWCSRMTNVGYLDATDWDGVYKSEGDAMLALSEFYGDKCDTCEARGCEGECGA